MTLTLMKPMECLMEDKATFDLWLIQKLHEADIKQSDLAETVKVSKQQVGHWIKGRQKPSKDKLQRIVNALRAKGIEVTLQEALEVGEYRESASGPSVNIEDVSGFIGGIKDHLESLERLFEQKAHGDGSPQPESDPKGQFSNQPADRKENEASQHPRYFADGTPDVPDELKDFEQLGLIYAADYAPILGSVPCGDPDDRTQDAAIQMMAELGGDFLIKADGDSMEPHIPDGVWAVVQLSIALEKGRIYIIGVDGKLTCKRYAGEVEENGQPRLRFVPTNGKYAALLAENVTVRGRVVGKVERL